MIYNFNYIITNNINSKQYVGAHRTKKLNDGYMGSGKLINYAKKKYRKENFTREILEYFDTFEEALKNESKYIKKYNTLASNGYNLTTGGQGGDNFSNKTEIKKEKTKKRLSKALKGNTNVRGKKTINKDNEEKRVEKEDLQHYLDNGWELGFTEEHKRNISKGTKGRKFSKSHIKKISKLKKGNTNVKGKIWIYKNNEYKRVKEEELQDCLDDGWKKGGKLPTKETKQKMSKAHKGNTITKETIWVHKDNQNKRIKKEEKQKYLGNNWRLRMFKTDKT